MKPKIILATLALVAHADCAGDIAGNPSTFADMLGRNAVLGMKLATEHSRREGKVSAIHAECIQALPDSGLNDIFNAALQSVLTEADIAAADKYFTSPEGRKYALIGTLRVYEQVGEKPPQPVPTLSESELAAFNEFAKTSAAEKLFGQKVIEGPAVKQAMEDGIRAMDSRCKSPKPAPP